MAVATKDLALSLLFVSPLQLPNELLNRVSYHFRSALPGNDFAGH